MDCVRSINETLCCLDELSRGMPDEQSNPLRLAAAHLQLARDLLDEPQPPQA